MKKLFTAIVLIAMGMSVFSQERMSPELLWKLKRVGSPVMSPDQSKFIYSISEYEIDSNSGENVLYVYDIATGKTNQLCDLKGWEGNVRWNPTGTKVGFKHNGQLWEVKPDGSELKQVSFFKESIGGFEYAPNGKHILYIQDVKLEQTVNEMYEDLPHADARIIDDLMYRHWDSWNDYKYTHVFYTAYSDSIVEGMDIMEGEKFDSPMKPFGGMGAITWNHDGSSIAYVCKKKSGKAYAESTNSEIYIYNIASKETKNITEGMMGYDKHPTFSPDGKYIAWQSMETPGYEADKNRIFIMELATGAKTELTKGWDQNGDGIKWAKDSKSIYFNSGIHATNQVYNVKLGGGIKNIKQLTEGDYNHNGFAVGKKYIYVARQDMNRPTEIYKVNKKKASDVTVITHANDEIYSKLETGKIEKRWVKTSDDKEMLVWVIYPPNFNPEKKYPTLLYCQGGPQSAVSQFFSYRWNFQLMAANDYIIVAPNRRGLPSFGQEWNHEISKDWGGQSMRDYLAAIDAVSKESYVDNEKLGAIGASYGGYSVYYLAGIHENRFSAFISHCGLFNLESWYGTTEELFFANYDNRGPYWEKPNMEYYAKNSPHKLVHNWNTPMLVIHGEKDFRVPLGEGMQAFQAAQIKGIPSKFLYFPEENHWVLSPQNGVLWHRVFFEWLDQWLKK